jgi:hypothetical protein
MHLRYIWAAAFLLFLTVNGCSNAPLKNQPLQDTLTVGSPALSTSPAVPATGFILAPPSELIKHEATAVLVEITGAAHVLGVGQNLGGEGSTAVFDCEWGASRANEDLAWGMYYFNLQAGDTPGDIVFTWADEPAFYWIGLANDERDTWDWLPAGESMISVPQPSDKYVNHVDQLYLTIVVLSSGEYALQSLRVDSLDFDALENLFFLHHSTGQGFINAGMRGYIDDYNTANGTDFEFWDHCYTWPSDPDWPGGLVNPDGEGTEESYGAPCDATDPWDLMMLWTSDEGDYPATRNLILDNHEVIAFKSCFPASNISTAEQLQEYQEYYLAMLDVFDARPDRLFIVMSTPPLRMEDTVIENANRARLFANWLSSAEYLDGHPNIVCFDLFDVLANDGGPQANTLRFEYCTPDGDSHPNADANDVVAPLLAQFFIDSALAYGP